MAVVKAWPICKLPVTFGGGAGMTKVSCFAKGSLYSGLKNP